MYKIIAILALMAIAQSKLCPEDVNCRKCTIDADATKNVCAVCSQDFIFDANSKECKKVDPLIPNCEEYDAADAKVCKKCKANFFFSGSTPFCADKCADEKCARCDSDKDKCEFCSTDHLLNATNLKCVLQTDAAKKLAGCLEIKGSTTDTAIECLVCSDKFMLKDKRCVEQKPSGCMKATDDTKCEICANGFYMGPKYTCVDAKKSENSSTIWYIVGAIIGGVIVIGLIVYFISQKNKKNQDNLLLS
jgi:hypothetical protein